MILFSKAASFLDTASSEAELRNNLGLQPKSMERKKNQSRTVLEQTKGPSRAVACGVQGMYATLGESPHWFPTSFFPGGKILSNFISRTPLVHHPALPHPQKQIRPSILHPMTIGSFKDGQENPVPLPASCSLQRQTLSLLYLLAGTSLLLYLPGLNDDPASSLMP